MTAQGRKGKGLVADAWAESMWRVPAKMQG